METKEIQKEQHLLVECMKDEVAKPKEDQSTFYNSIWFYPQKGGFLYGDRYMSIEVVIPLLNEGIIKFKGYENHQGEKMLRYILS